MATPDDAHTASETPPPRWRRLLRRALQAIGGVVAFVVALVLIVLLLLQTPWGAKTAAQLIAQQVNPFTNATIQVGSTGGNWLQTLELRDVELIPTARAADTDRFAHIDTLRVRYRLPALLRNTVHVQNVRISGPSASLYQRADSTWALPEVEPAEPDTTPSDFPLTIRVDRVHLARGAATARFYAPERDSTLYVQDFRIGAREIEYSSALTARLDTLGMDAVLPGIETPLHLQAAATLASDRLVLDGLDLTSPHSKVHGAGTLRFPQTADEEFDDVDFTLTAAPLSFQDIAPFVPGAALDPNEQLHLDVQARGSDDLVELLADARLSTGGTLTLNATATPSLPDDVETTAPGPLRYRVDAEARGLGTDILTTEDLDAPTRVNVDVQVDLEGPALNQLSGTTSVRLFDAQLAGYAVHTALIEMSTSDGQVILDGGGDFAGATFAARGTLEPFEETPTYDLYTRLSDLDIGAFMDDAEQESALNAELHLTGEGWTAQTAQATAQLDVLPSTINRQRIESGRLTLRYADHTLRYDTRLAFPEGQLAAAGQALFEEPIQYTVERGRLDDVHVAALMGDTTSSALNGTFHLSGRDLTPDAMQLQANLELRNSHYGPYVLHGATTRTTLQDGNLNLDLNAALRGGQFELAAIAQPFAEPITLRTTRGRFQDVDIGPFLQDTTQSSDLNGTFRLSARGVDSLGTWTAHVALDSSRINQQPLTSARLDAAFEQARADFAVQLDAPSGRTRFAGHARPFDDVPTYALTEGTLDELDIGALAGMPNARTRLNGTFTLQGRGVDPAAMSLDMNLDLGASMLNAAELERGALETHIDDGEGSFDGQFELAQGRMTLQGTMRPQDERPAYHLRGRFDDVNAAALAGIDTLASHVSLGVELEGEGFDPETLDLRGRVTAQDTRYAALRLDTLDARVQMTNGLLQVDTLMARSNVATAQGGGQVALFDARGLYTSNLLVEARTTNLTPLQSMLGIEQLAIGEGRFEGRVYGRPGSVRFDASTTFTDLVYGDMRLADFETQVAGARGDTTMFSTLEVRGRLGLLSHSNFSIENTKFSARYQDDEIDFTTAITIDRERNAQIRGAADLRPGQERVTLETLDMQLGPDRWALLQEASIAYGDVYRINNLLLYSGQQQFAADGVIDFDGTQSLIVTLENVNIAAFTDLLGYEGLGGQLSGTLAMNGTAESPHITSTVNLDVRSSDADVGHLQLRAEYDNLRADIDALLTHVDGSTLSMEGHVPADLRLAASDTADVMNDPVDLTLTANAFSIGWIEPFLDPETVGAINGQFNADAAISGTLNTPILSGNGRLRNASLELPQLGTTYDRISANLDFTGEEVLVREASARSSGGGRLQAKGAINLADLTLGAYDLSVTTTNFLAIDTREYRARVDSDLAISGTTQRPVVEGSAQVESADVYFEANAQADANVMTVQLSPEDQQTLERRFGVRITEADTTTIDTYEAMALDMRVRFQRDTWLRSRANPNMDIQFTGALDVQKEHFQDAQVFGNIEVIPERSRVVQFGREFLIDEGALTFNGPPEAPMMDIRAVYAVRTRGSQENEVEVTLDITGSPEDLNLDLGSNPPMETGEIFCYIALARPCGGANHAGTAPTENGAGDQSLGERLAIGQAAGLIENMAATQLGLDVVRIEPRPDGTISLTAGQYLSPRFYAAVQQSITTNQPGAQMTSNVPDITLEYEFTRWLLLRTLYRDPDLRLNLFWEYAY